MSLLPQEVFTGVRNFRRWLTSELTTSRCDKSSKDEISQITLMVETANSPVSLEHKDIQLFLIL